MRKCALLLKVQLLGFFNINRVIHTNDKKEKRRLINVGALMLFVAIIMMINSAGLAISLVKFKLSESIPALIVLMSAVITLVTSFLKSNGMLFEYHDYDMVMSLPVKNITIVISRMLTIYAMNVLFSAIIMLPSLVVYAVANLVSPSIYCMMTLSLFLVPLLPMVLSMTIATLITAISMRFRYKNLLIILLSILAVLALMLVTFRLPMLEGTFAELVKTLMQTVYRIYPLANWYANALNHADWSSFGLFSLVSIAAIIVFVFLLSMFYKKIHSALSAVRSKNDYRMTSLRVSTPFLALYKKELRRLFSTPIYVMNTCLGAILLLVTACMFLFLNIEQIGDIMGYPNISVWIKTVAPFIITAFLSFSSSTQASISLEGKSRWLMCSSPVPVMTIFHAKIAVSLSYLIPSACISAILFSVGLETNMIETISILLISLLFSIFISVAGLAWNLKFPSYDWTTEQQAVKQSISVLATIFTGFAFTFLFGFLAVILKESSVLSLLLTVMLLSLFIIVIYKKMNKQKLYI